MTELGAFDQPNANLLSIGERPRLESWNRAGDPDQVALSSYLDRLEQTLSAQLSVADTGPLSLRLQVGLPETMDVLTLRDLDNYALPIARRLDPNGGRIVSVHAVKGHAADSFVSVGGAVVSVSPDQSMCVVDCTESHESAAYKHQISAAAGAIGLLPDGPVQLELRFAMNARPRNWQHLWKPTIDALGLVLGRDPGAAQWNSRDGRITDLRLHRTIDPVLSGWTVRVGITARNLIQIPAIDNEARLIEFAYESAPSDVRFDGLDALTDGVALQWAYGGGLPDELDALRRVLYFLQRQHRHTENQNPLGSFPIVSALLAEIRRQAPAGFPRQLD